MTNISFEDIYTKIEDNKSFDFNNIKKNLLSMLNTVKSKDILKK